MNERIFELTKEANLGEIIDDAYQERNDWAPYVRKFAELIIRECAAINYNSPFKDGEFHAREILEHFGVK